MKIFLEENRGFKWYCSDNIYVKGYFFDEENNFYEKEKLTDYFANTENEIDFKNKIKKTNGCFSVLIKKDNKTLVASDKTRFFPIFYTSAHDETIISDKPFKMVKFLNSLKTDKIQVEFFKSAGYTFSDKTLIDKIQQIKPAQYIIFEDEKIIKSEIFYSYTIKETYNEKYNELKNIAIDKFKIAFKRLIQSLNGRQAVVPLSGGYDSRLIAVMLKYYGYENVLCFTFGKKNNNQIENSKKSAERLGFKWLFIEYNDNISNNYFDTNLFKEYAKFAGKITSMPYLQEYFAVKYLKENKLIDEDAVFLPGHSGDVLGGSQFVKVFPENIKLKQIPKLYFKKKIFLGKIPFKYKSKIIKLIKNEINQLNKKNEEVIPYSIFEDLDLKEKFAKFIFNSSNVFDFFGYEVRFPFWDNELVTFFTKLPAKYRKLKLLYDDVLINHFFRPYNVAFSKELQSSLTEIKLQKLKNYLKKYLPAKYKIKRLKKNDWIGYDILTLPMKKEISIPDKKILKFNSIITNWYIYFIQKEIEQKNNYSDETNLRNQ